MSTEIDEDDGLAATVPTVDPLATTAQPASQVVLVINETTYKYSKTRRKSSNPSEKPPTVSNKSKSNQNSRMQPINERIRSVFEIFRNRLNTSENQKTTTNTTGKPKYTKSCSQQQQQQNTQTNNQVIQESNEDESLCQLCFSQCSPYDKQDGSNFLFSIETCEHSFCLECLRQYLKYQIIESRVSISCPQCSEKMHPSDIYKLLLFNQTLDSNCSTNTSIAVAPVSPQSTNSLLKPTSNHSSSSSSLSKQTEDWSQLVVKYEEFMLRRVLVTIPDTRWCPAPDCSYAVIATGCANCPQLHCMRPNCNTSFCYHCKQYWHPNLTCEDAALRNNQNAMNSILNLNGQDTANRLRSFLQRSNSHISQASSITGALNANNTSTVLTSRNLNGDWVKEEIKRCPKCQALIVKMDDGSCNHITCSVCGCEFCWLCMKEISDLHYLSPSGCTFWGKKPWSRKKKILWQLGTLIGAPVGIALIAGVAVPAILIGLPIWAGRKVYIRYKTIGKHKRNLIVVGTVVGTILVAPLVAALAVGIGVPILLAYVYGVVPISLCRSGGCGVTTNNNGGVRFAFDDETTTDNQAVFNFSSSNNTTSIIPTKLDEQKNKDESVYFNSVTVPISAIEPKPDSVVVSTHSNKTEAFTTTSKNSPGQTPLFVTITMANSKSPNNLTSSKSKSSKSRNRSSSTSSRKRSKSHKKLIQTSSLLSSASTACGSVELPSPNQTINITRRNSSNTPPRSQSKSIAAETETQTGTGTSVLSIKHLRTSKTNSDNELNTSSSSNSSHQLLDSILDESSNPQNVNKQTKCTKKSGSKQLNENQIKKLISSKIVNNPSIGEISIGLASLSMNQDYDEEEGEEDDFEYSSGKKVEQSLKALNEDRSDRDSASNRAIASESINKYTNLEKRKSISKSNSNDTNLVFEDKKSLNLLRDELESKIELKSNYTINSYNEQKTISSLAADIDTCSVSIISEKSINPSVSGLVGSIKDNISVSQF